MSEMAKAMMKISVGEIFLFRRTMTNTTVRFDMKLMTTEINFINNKNYGGGGGGSV